jgi:ATP-dependent DNA ligase
MAAVRAPPRPSALHEIKLDGFRMAARIDNGRAQLLTRTGLDWSEKYPSAIAAFANVKARTAHLDGELCGVDDAGLPSFAHTQARAKWRLRSNGSGTTKAGAGEASGTPLR